MATKRKTRKKAPAKKTASGKGPAPKTSARKATSKTRSVRAGKSKADKTKSKVAKTSRKKRASGFSSMRGLAASLAFVDKRDDGTLPLFVVAKVDYAEWLESAPDVLSGWLRGTSFKPTVGASSLLPGVDGPIAAVVVVEDETCQWDYARLPKDLPAGRYEVEPEFAPEVANALCIGWALGTYRFETFKQKSSNRAMLVWPEEAERETVLAIAEGTFLARDLINMPASDMGPAELSDETARLAQAHKAEFSQVVGDQLLKRRYPMIHAVGRASSRSPRLLELVWGKPKDPKLTLVGKGVCFDSGGLDIKPGQYMKLMKKDMGGAALVLGLAHAVMSVKLPVRLRVLIPAVENSVSGNAMRPLDVLDTRKGMTVEVGDTDAEGRLVLADALTEAVAEDPELVVDVATLTGAARVALGTGMPAVFATRAATWNVLEEAAAKVHDPVWRLPLHEPYRKKLDSAVADISSTGDAYGGAISAALFLREFAGRETDWLHIDTMGYNLEARPGRPRGGEALALMALLRTFQARFG